MPDIPTTVSEFIKAEYDINNTSVLVSLFKYLSVYNCNIKVYAKKAPGDFLISGRNGYENEDLIKVKI